MQLNIIRERWKSKIKIKTFYTELELKKSNEQIMNFVLLTKLRLEKDFSIMKKEEQEEQIEMRVNYLIQFGINYLKNLISFYSWSV